jgi:hypothetical protein
VRRRSAPGTTGIRRSGSPWPASGRANAPGDQDRMGMNPKLRYYPAYCTILKQHVWAILARQPEGGWRTVNCLDKEPACASLPCLFTSERGAWPYLHGFSSESSAA